MIQVEQGKTDSSRRVSSSNNSPLPYSNTYTYKTKCHCELCGRHIYSGISIDSKERVLCTFCEKNLKDAINAEKERERQGTQMKPCKACGKLAYLDKWLKLCPECYFKTERPTITAVTEVKSNFHREKYLKKPKKPPHSVKCPVCGVVFETTSGNKKYCSKPCVIKVENKRMRERYQHKKAEKAS